MSSTLVEHEKLDQIKDQPPVATLDLPAVNTLASQKEPLKSPNEFEDSQPIELPQQQQPISWRKKCEKFSWYMYDWANSTFITQVVSTFLPWYFQKVVVVDKGTDATIIWAYASAIALAIVALLLPMLGALGDEFGIRKLLLLLGICIGSLTCALQVFTGSGMVVYCMILYIVSRIAYGIADSFYNSLLMFIAHTEEEMNDASSKGYMLGYLGGGLLLLVTSVVFIVSGQNPLVIQIQHVIVAVWWFLFSIPMLVCVQEPHNATMLLLQSNSNISSEQVKEYVQKQETENAKKSAARRCCNHLISAARASTLRLVQTFKEIIGFRQLFLFLVAFWFYNDGISTIITMAIAFAAEIKDDAGNDAISATHLFLAMLLVQFVAVPATYIFIPISNKIGAKFAILIGLFVYTLITIANYFLGKYTVFGLSIQTTAVIHFYVMAIIIASILGFTQALSRSLFALLTPKSKSSEFFGFFGLSGKFAGIMGPLLFGLMGSLTQNSRMGMISVAVFFVIGGVLLLLVKVQKGIEYAQEFEQKRQGELFSHLQTIGIVKNDNTSAIKNNEDDELKLTGDVMVEVELNDNTVTSQQQQQTRQNEKQ